MKESLSASLWGIPYWLSRLNPDYLPRYRLVIVLSLAAMLLGSLLLLPIALVQGCVLDQLIASAREGSVALATEVRQIVLALVITLMCYLGRLTLLWRSNAVMNRVSLEVVRELTDALHHKYQRLPMTYFDQRETGQLMARITSDVGSLLIFLGSGTLQLASDLVLALGIAAVLVWLRWEMALVCFLVMPLYALAHRLLTGRIQGLSRRVRAQVGAVYALLSERISAVRVVRSFAQEEMEILQLDERIDAHRALSRDCLRAGALQVAVAAAISGAGTVAVLATGVLLIRSGRFSVGDLLAFTALTAQLYNPLVRLIQFQPTAAGTRIAIERMLEVLDEPETLTDDPEAHAVESPCGRLVFRDVSFRYRPDGPLILDCINLEIEPGMTVGVLGPSGAGKSTLLALAPRLYDVDQGSIQFDGRNVKQLRMAELRRAVALVPQQAVLFEGTLRSNLLYAAPAASGAALTRVLDRLDLAQLVDSLPLGLETPVGERGFSLSGGQRQRLALARALLAEPAILLMDDCITALDAETEAHVRAAVNDLLPGRTRLIVAHKFDCLRDADWIIVLERGRIVEQGSPKDLKARPQGLFGPLTSA